MIKNNKGFMLLETLIVTSFVSFVLIYLFIQISNITSNYSTSLTYNMVDDIYALEDLKEYIISDELLVTYILNDLEDGYISIDSCNSSLFTDVNYCQNLLNNLRINSFIISQNNLDELDFSPIQSEGIKKFISTLKNTNSSEYRIIAIIDKQRYASIIFDLGSGV